MDTAYALLDIHRVPWQVEIEQDASKLKIDALAPGRRADQHSRAVLLAEAPLRCNLGAMVATAQYNHALAGEGTFDFARDQIHCAKVRGEDHDLLAGVLAPQRA